MSYGSDVFLRCCCPWPSWTSFVEVEAGLVFFILSHSDPLVFFAGGSRSSPIASVYSSLKTSGFIPLCLKARMTWVQKWTNSIFATQLQDSGAPWCVTLTCDQIYHWKAQGFGFKMMACFLLVNNSMAIKTICSRITFFLDTLIVIPVKEQGHDLSSNKWTLSKFPLHKTGSWSDNKIRK